jgi:hypothetical protein
MYDIVVVLDCEAKAHHVHYAATIDDHRFETSQASEPANNIVTISYSFVRQRQQAHARGRHRLLDKASHQV